jgi:hypothetical protein
MQAAANIQRFSPAPRSPMKDIIGAPRCGGERVE